MYERLLVPLDGSERAQIAAGYAKHLAEKSGASVTLVHVCTAAADLRNIHQAYVDHHAEALRGALDAAGSDVRVEPVVIEGDPATEILSYAEQHDVDLIVMTSHGRTGVSRWLRGSVAERVLRHASVPVRVLRADATEPAQAAMPERSILVLLDGSPTAEQVLPHVAEHSKMFAAPITLLRVCDAPFINADYPEATMELPWEEHVERITRQERELCHSYLDQVATRLSEEGVEVRAEAVLSDESTPQAIVDYLAEHPVDLVAMTTHGRAGIGRLWMGSVADRLLHELKTPLLLVRSR